MMEQTRGGGTQQMKKRPNVQRRCEGMDAIPFNSTRSNSVQSDPARHAGAELINSW